MNDFVLCGHTGSINRGADAIVKSTADLLSEFDAHSILASYKKEDDENYGFNEYDSVIRYADYKKHFALKMLSVVFRLLKKDGICEKIRQIPVISYLKKHNAICISVGGDTYCYSMEPYQFQEMNKACKKNNIPSVLWGCSIERNIAQQKSRLRDLKNYDYIFPREQESYDVLIKAGIDPQKLVKMCDPAFTLKPEKVSIVGPWLEKGFIAINISPLPFNLNGNPELVKMAYKRLIDRILTTTNYNIVLVPHVYQLNDKEYKDDIFYHRMIRALYEDNKEFYDRIISIETFYNSKQIKYIISQSKLLVATRTHASIAGYSSCVPTLVVGYSIKAVGIARDLFGTDKNYVLMGQNISSENDIANAYEWMSKHSDIVRERLCDVIPAYVKQAEKATEFLVSRFLK